MIGVEVNYSSMEKIYLDLVFAVQKLRHYLLSHQITVISKADQLRYILSKSLPSGRLAKWAMLLAPFDIKFVPQIWLNDELSDDLSDDGVMFVETKSW